jgi:hypothetical protein
MMFEFKKQNKILGIGCGYYFKDVFLSRYKTEAIRILRNRIEEAGSKVGDRSKSSWEKGQLELPDEAKVLKDEWLKGEERTRKTHAKKKQFYKEIHKRVLKRKIVTLQERIRLKEERKIFISERFDIEIQSLKDEIAKLEEALK